MGKVSQSAKDSGTLSRACGPLFISPTGTNGQKNTVSKDQPGGGGEWRQKGLSPSTEVCSALSPQSLPQQVGGEETDPRVCHRVCPRGAPCPPPWTSSEATLRVREVWVCPAFIRPSSLHTLEEFPGLRPPPRYCEMQAPGIEQDSHSTNSSSLPGGQNAEMESKGKRRTVSSPLGEKALEILRSRSLKALTICLPGQELSGRKGRKN